MFSVDPKIDVDECYTLTQRDLKYTLIHSRQKRPRSTLIALMNLFDREYGIKSSSVFGYNAVSIGEETEDHPGFKLLVEHMNSGSTAFEYWMADGTLQTNKKGILFKYLQGESVKNNQLTRSQLIHKLDLAEKKIFELEKRKAEADILELKYEQVCAENKRLKIRNRTNEMLFRNAGREAELLPPSP